MASVKSWIKAARPRTLPLALSGILMGCGLAWFYGAIEASISLLAIVTATFIQIFSNFANDFGDNQRGTDNEFRLGPTRTMQSGEITHLEMKRGMVAVGGLSFLLGLLLVYMGVWHHSQIVFFSYICLGVLSLVAAYFYTAGKKSYGYVGLGDLAVFLFFGLLPVIGVFYLNANYLETIIVLPAISIGFFSTGVLNLNNMRDIQNDKQSGKITLPVRMGAKNSRVYHATMIFWGWFTSIIFTLYQQDSLWQWLFLLTLPLFIRDLIMIFQIEDERQFDPFLKKLSLSTLAFTLLFCVGLIIASV